MEQIVFNSVRDTGERVGGRQDFEADEVGSNDYLLKGCGVGNESDIRDLRAVLGNSNPDFRQGADMESSFVAAWSSRKRRRAPHPIRRNFVARWVGLSGGRGCRSGRRKRRVLACPELVACRSTSETGRGHTNRRLFGCVTADQSQFKGK